MGTAFLVAAVVGSGIMGERLAGGEYRYCFAGQHDCDWRGIGFSHPDIWADFWRASEPGGHAGGRDRARDRLERCGRVYRCPMRRRSCRGDRCASDVWAALVFLFVTRSPRVGTGLQRICCDFRFVVGDLGMLAVASGSGAVCGCELYHGRLLVHGVDLVRESGGDDRTVFVGHLRGDPACGRGLVHWGTGGGSFGGDRPVSLACSGLRRAGAGCASSLGRGCGRRPRIFTD